MLVYDLFVVTMLDCCGWVNNKCSRVCVMSELTHASLTNAHDDNPKASDQQTICK